MLLLFASLLASAQLRAETPELRARLFTLEKPQEITVTAARDARVAWGRGKEPEPMPKSLTVQAAGNKLLAAGRTLPAIFLAGEYSISTGGRSQRIAQLTEISARGGELYIVAHFPLEEYVAAAVQGESAGEMPTEALKALAVASRSFALRFRGRHSEEGFDFCDTTHDQVLRTEISPKVRQAVEATAGELLWVKGSLLAAYFHKDCGGRTEAAEELWPGEHSPALSSHADNYCLRRTQPWRTVLSRRQIDEALRRSGIAAPQGWRQMAIEQRSSSGRARLLRLGAMPLSATSFRTAIGRELGWNVLKSDLYELTMQSDGVLFTGRGVGHGVGLCQTGSAEMAAEGKDYKSILASYYPSAQLGRSAQGAPWLTQHGANYDLRAASKGDLAKLGTAAEKAWAEMLTRSGLSVHAHPEITLYPSVELFRNSTGEPGWVAASTRGEHVSLQPAAKLGAKMEPTLRHELLHLAVEEKAAAGLPLWFREGLVLYFDSERARGAAMTPRQIDTVISSRASLQEQQRAYASAETLVETLARRYGRASLLTWLQHGLPQGLVSGDALPAVK
jgi:stage II sporulation protein D